MNRFYRCLAWLVLFCLVLPAALANATAVETRIAEIQKYGNLVLEITGSDFLTQGYAYGDVISANICGVEYDMPVCSNYSDVNEGSTVCRVVIDEASGEDRVVLAINMGDLATKAGVAVKTAIEAEPGYRWEGLEEASLQVKICMREKEGYLAAYSLRSLSRSNVRADYAQLTDAEFANFREVQTPGMRPGTLYRSSSPVNPELGRNSYADAAACAAGVRTVVNLADSKAAMQAYPGWDESYYSGCNVIGLNLGIDFTLPDFQAGLAEGLRFMAENEGPYLVHCTEGKDRAGFVSALLECLMGADADAVVADYMVTYFNYYGVEPGSERYASIAQANIQKSLAHAFEIEDIFAEGVDLAAEAGEYMLEKLGLSEDELSRLCANLSAK